MYHVYFLISERNSYCLTILTKTIRDRPIIVSGYTQCAFGCYARKRPFRRGKPGKLAMKSVFGQIKWRRWVLHLAGDPTCIESLFLCSRGDVRARSWNYNHGVSWRVANKPQHIQKSAIPNYRLDWDSVKNEGRLSLPFRHGTTDKTGRRVGEGIE